MVRDLKGKHQNYYECIVQLRDSSPEVVAYVEKRIETRNIIVVKVVEVKNGSDYFLADNQQGRSLSKKLQENFGGEVNITSSLHTKKDNKELYRTTILFREAPFRRNNVVEYHEEIYVIKAMTKDIFLQHQKTGKKIHVKYKEMHQIKKV